MLSQVERFLNSSHVKLKSWTQELKLSWKAELDNLIQQLDLTQQEVDK